MVSKIGKKKKAIIDDVIRSLHYRSVDEVVVDSLLVSAMSKLSEFNEECEHYKTKYGASLAEFKRTVEKEKEDFEKYDDLMAWQFAEEGKSYWQKKIEELKNVS